MAATAEGWWASHLRPRDVFILGAMALLLVLAGLVWSTRRAGEDVETIVSLILGCVSTLGGYYQGQKEADDAKARADAAGRALRDMQDELRRAREELAEAKTTLAAALPLLAELSPEKKQ